MKLTSFSVSNYRSITRAHRIKLQDLTILVGKNNEGKSNIIKALSLSLNMIKNYSEFSRRIPTSVSRYRLYEKEYIWQRDFPINSQTKKNGSKTSRFELDFELNDEELVEFNKVTSSNLSTSDFTIIIEVGQDNNPKYKISKQGTSKLSEKVKKVTEFVANNLVFNYIPAIRTEDQAIDIISDTISEELKVLEDNSEYIQALKTINDLQKKPLNEIAKKVKKTLQTFIPTINDVTIEIEETLRKLSLRRSIEVSVDDGALTNIEFKGDGIKSLATLAMLTNRYNTEQSSIIAIDEPEAHLHPEANRQLNSIIERLVKDNQVIIATHNPLFINRKEISSNVIVSSGKASPAKNIRDIRETLGVKLSDNLISCSCKIFVEGLTDKKIIEAICLKNPVIKKALLNGEISIEAMGGASKLLSKLYESNNTLFDYYVFLDNDEAGKKAFEKSLSENLIEVSKVTFSNCDGKGESEIEDLIDCKVYLDKINEKYGTFLKKEDFSPMKKWSDQVKEAFQHEGKPWNEKIEEQIKIDIADICHERIMDGEEIFLEYRKEPINALVRNIERMIEKKSNV